MPSSKPENQPAFSIDEFIGEIEKAEDERLGKRLPQERLKNKRALDNAARRAAEAAGTGIKPLVPQPVRREDKQTALKKSKKDPTLEQAEADGLIVDKGKGKRSAATGMISMPPAASTCQWHAGPRSMQRPTAVRPSVASAGAVKAAASVSVAVAIRAMFESFICGVLALWPATIRPPYDHHNVVARVNQG